MNASLFELSAIPGYSPLREALSGSQKKRQSPHRQGKAAPQPPSKVAPTPACSTGGDDGGSWVRTDEDAAVYFQRHGAEARTQFFFAIPADGTDAASWDSANAAAALLALRVVPAERIALAPMYYVLSQRQVVCISRRTGEHTDTIPLQGECTSAAHPLYHPPLPTSHCPTVATQPCPARRVASAQACLQAHAPAHLLWLFLAGQGIPHLAPQRAWAGAGADPRPAGAAPVCRPPCFPGCAAAGRWPAGAVAERAGGGRAAGPPAFGSRVGGAAGRVAQPAGGARGAGRALGAGARG